jgi:hypothetical protein
VLGLTWPGRAAAQCLSTAVEPFPLFEYPSYWVEVLDGGEGDFDGVVDGACDLRIRFCFGVACSEEPLRQFRLYAQSIDGRGLADSLREKVLEELASYAGGSLDESATRVTFDPPIGMRDTCVTARIRLKVPLGFLERRTLTLRPFVNFSNGRLVRTKRVRVACWKSTSKSRSFPLCRRQARQCDMKDSLGYAPALPPERPPPPPPPPPGVSTTTTTSTRPLPTTTSTSLPPPPPPPPGSTGRTFYLSPNGSDTNSGTSTSAPWKTFRRVLREDKVLQPGDQLVLLNGTYTRGTTGVPTIDCSAGGTANHGTATKPITIRAQNERQARLQSDGAAPALLMTDCRYWNVAGLHGRNADNANAAPWVGHVFSFKGVSHVRATKLLAARPNRTCSNSTLAYCNVHAISIDESDDVLLEDAEVYDFHRHGVSAFKSSKITVRRTYINSRYNDTSHSTSGVILYGSSDSVIENSVTEGLGGASVAGSKVYDGTPGGYRNKILGHIGLNNRYGSTIRARRFGGPVLPVGDNLIRNSVYAFTSGFAVFSRGAHNTMLENVTIFRAAAGGFRADHDLGEGAPCSAIPGGCSFRTTNLLTFNTTDGVGIGADPTAVPVRLVENSNSDNNARGDFNPSETISDGSGSIRYSLSTAPGMGLGSGQCLVYVPGGSPMKQRGKNGADIGANVLYRYVNGALTNQPLWNPTTGAFPCGAIVPGVNDVAGKSCFDVHKRLNVGTNGCPLPY